ncbi:hypothetical protein LP420_04495 [Massilia sp. B-10]|nr:hypothetical protein LP420_04495 [Massilia sp. B-10]
MRRLTAGHPARRRGAASQSTRQEPSVSTYADLSFTSTDGLALYARDYPAHSGPAKLPVICLHGLTRNSADFDELAPWIAAQGRQRDRARRARTRPFGARPRARQLQPHDVRL